MAGAHLLMPHEIKQEPPDPAEVDPAVNLHFAPATVNAQTHMPQCVCNQPKCVVETSPEPSRRVSSDTPGVPTATPPCNESAAQRQVLVEFGLNRKKVFNLENDGVDLKSKLEAHIRGEEAFADLLKSCYIVLQVFSLKFNTWVDAEDVDLLDGSVVNALFFPRKVEGDEENPGVIKKRNRERSDVSDESKEHTKDKPHRKKHKKNKEKNKETEKYTNEMNGLLEEGELPPEDEEPEVTRSKRRKKKRRSRVDDRSSAGSTTPHTSATSRSPLTRLPQPELPMQQVQLELPRPMQQEQLELPRPLLPPHMLQQPQVPQTPLLQQPPLHSLPTQRPLPPVPMMPFLEQQQLNQHHWMMTPPVQTWPGTRSPQMQGGPSNLSVSSNQGASSSGKKKNSKVGKKKMRQKWAGQYSNNSYQNSGALVGKQTARKAPYKANQITYETIKNNCGKQATGKARNKANEATYEAIKKGCPNKRKNEMSHKKFYQTLYNKFFTQKKNNKFNKTILVNDNSQNQSQKQNIANVM